MTVVGWRRERVTSNRRRPGASGGPLQKRQEKTVGAVGGGRQHQVGPRARRLSRQYMRPDVGHRHGVKIGLLGQERLDHVLAFGPERGTDRIAQPAAGPDEARALGQEPELAPGVAGQQRRRQAQPALRLAPPGADAGTGGVDQYPVHPAGEVVRGREGTVRPR